MRAAASVREPIVKAPAAEETNVWVRGRVQPAAAPVLPDTRMRRSQFDSAFSSRGSAPFNRSPRKSFMSNVENQPIDDNDGGWTEVGPKKADVDTTAEGTPERFPGARNRPNRPLGQPYRPGAFKDAKPW